MTTQQLLALDPLTVVLGGVLYAVAGILTAALGASPTTSRGRARAALACAGLALLVTVVRILLVVVLAGRGWWFAGEKVLLGVPLAIASIALVGVVALPALLRAVGERATWQRAGGRRLSNAAAALLAAAYATLACVLVTFVVGYPVSVWPAVTVFALVVGLSGLTWLGLQRRRRPGLTAGFLVLCILPALTGTAVAFYRDIQPVVVGAAGHGHLAAGPTTGGTGATGEVSVADLRATPDGTEPVRTFTLTARRETVTLPSGRTVDGWTFGSLPGPEIRVTQGDPVEVTLVNLDVEAGVTVHWHGYPVPAGDDGVAGVTQDAVLPGESFTYRFVATEAGTYWYHAHQVSSEAVARGLFGAFIVEPAESAAETTDAAPRGLDLTLPVHTIEGITLVGASDQVERPEVQAGAPVRLRFINTDSQPHRISISGTPFTVTAVDGTRLHAPTQVTGPVLPIPAGGRYEVEFPALTTPVAVGVEGAPETGVWLDPLGGPPAGPMFTDGADLDLLDYGAPADTPGLTDQTPDREVTLVLDRQLRFLDGIPTLAQSVNGEVYPHVPPITVRESELIRLTVVNRSSETHPMHPHGHRVLVQSRDGIPVRGSPLWLDTFDVRPGEVWEVLLLADNPGIWMAHCHNLDHATQGMVVHLVYEGVSTPYGPGGNADNRPE